MKTIDNLLKVATSRAKLLGSAGYTLPSFSSEATVIETTSDNLKLLSNLGISLIGDSAPGNWLILDPKLRDFSLDLRLRGGTQNHIVFGEGCSLRGSLSLFGKNSVFIASGLAKQGNTPRFLFNADNDGALIFLGKNFTSINSQWVVEGDNSTVVVGDDFMASWEVLVRNYDSHAVIDMATGSITNSFKDLCIGPHCWFGQRATITRGVTIGFGSIIALGAIVTTDIPPCSAVAGVPAKLVKSNTTWHRFRSPTKDQIDTLMGELSRYKDAGTYFADQPDVPPPVSLTYKVEPAPPSVRI